MRVWKRVAVVSITAALHSQHPALDAGTVSGTVHDREGAPIAGSSVRLEVRFESPDPFAGSAESLLRRFPLPRARTNRDGSFVLALVPDLREVGRLGLAWSLVVEHDGYETWNEHLARGLAGYLGSRVVLRPSAASDEVELVAEGALAGTGAVVLRGHDVRFVPFAADGRARLRLPRVPWPVQPGSAGGAVQVEAIVRAAPPGFTTDRMLTRPLHRFTRTEAPSVEVRRADGADVAGACALVRAVTENRWIDLPDATWTGPPPLAYAADGCRMSASPTLEPLPQTPPIRLRVLGADGAPVAGARALLLPAHDWRPRVHGPDRHPVPGERPGLQTLWRRPQVTDADGVLSLGDSLPADAPAVLVVVAEGFEPCEVLDPRGLADGAAVALQPRVGAAVDVRVTDTDGRPIEGALVCLSDAADAPAAVLGDRLVTGANGEVAVRGLVPGRVQVFAVRSGYVGSPRSVEASARRSERAEVILERADVVVLDVVDSAGRPAPFAPVVTAGRGAAAGRATRDHVLNADSAGRLVLHGPAAEFVDLGAVLEIEPAERPGGIGVLRVPRVEPVLVRAPAEHRSVMPIDVHRTNRLMSTRAPSAVVLMLAEADVLMARLPDGVVRLCLGERRDLPRDPVSGVLVFDVEFPTLRLEFDAQDADPTAWTAAPAVPIGHPEQPAFVTFPAARALSYRAADGTWRWTNPEARELRLLHPRHAPVVVTLDDAQARGEAPVVVTPQPGSPLSVEMPKGVVHAGVAVTLARTGRDEERFILRFENAKVVAEPDDDGQLRCVVTLPALSAGTWKVAVDAPTNGKRMQFEQEFTADGTTAVVVRAPR